MPEAQQHLGPQVAEQGWRSGSVFPAEAISCIVKYLRRPNENQPINVEKDDWVVLISQTCDVVAQKLASEPFVEVLHCRPIKKIRSQYSNLRSTRVIDFRPNQERHADTALSAHAISDRYLVPRECLAMLAPDPARCLDVIAVKRIAAWYAIRSTRPAWPDALVERLVGIKENIERVISPLADNLEVRISISPDEELPVERSYRVTIWFVVDGIAWGEDPDVRAAALRAYGEFVQLISACIGIEFDEESSGLFSGNDFTWQQTRSSDEWNFANLSNIE
jgi:hypothetical protein